VLEQQTTDAIVTIESQTEVTLNSTQQVADDLTLLSQLVVTSQAHLKDKMVATVEDVEDTLQSESDDLRTRLEGVDRDMFHNFTNSIADARDSLESGLDDTAAYLWEVARGLSTTTDFANGIRLEVSVLCSSYVFVLFSWNFFRSLKLCLSFVLNTGSKFPA